MSVVRLLSNGSSFVFIGKIKDDIEPDNCFVMEISELGIHAKLIDKSSSLRIKHTGDCIVRKISRYRTGITICIPKSFCKKLGWISGNTFISIYQIEKGKEYFFARSSPEEISNYATILHRYIPGEIKNNGFILLNADVRKKLGIKQNDILQCELNLETGNYIKLRKLSESETQYPSFKKHLYSPIFGVYSFNTDVCIKYSVKYHSKFYLPRIFTKANSLKPGDICSCKMLSSGELMITSGKERTCGICGKLIPSESAFNNKQICGSCAVALPKVQSAVSEYSGIDSAVEIVKTDVEVYLTTLQSKLTKMMMKN